MMWNRYDNGSGMMDGWFLVIFIIIAIVVALIIALVIFTIIKLVKTNDKKNISNNNNALSILNERLAKGEINIEEYTKLKNTLIK
ncbi:MAG: hypothetical protein FD141_936 [Fusobacteria bacterium]|nr:MAG: hypothetical protein FD141_936 [Fusobacteriota bacterium]KAF0229649.1 MAG: hypothetical protein FD182_39 [Fusobacteriota bacterium]